MAFTTADTLFALDPVDVNYLGHFYDDRPRGRAASAAASTWARSGWPGAPRSAWASTTSARTFDWRVRETIAYDDPVTGDYVQQVIARDVPLTSKVPTTAVANAAVHLGRFLVAGDVVRGVNVTTGHLGAETWLNKALAVRAGAYLDANELLQYTAGTGVRLGAIGVDLAVASHSRNLSRERGLELGAGLAFYH